MAEVARLTFEMDLKLGQDKSTNQSTRLTKLAK